MKKSIIAWIECNRKGISITAVICAIVFLVSCFAISYERTNMKFLQEEVDRKTSSAELITSFAKSVFDGATFGIFSEEGIFTEYNKASRWVDSVYDRDAAIRRRISFWMRIRTFSGALLIAFLAICVWYYRRRKTGENDGGEKL